jgi:hypothetical protein
MTIDGTVVIGEGERDEAPMLYIGEKVGLGGPKVDIALDPLEGTTITAKGGENAMAVIALAQDGGFLNAPDVYMEKISSQISGREKIISLQQDIKSNIKLHKMLLEQSVEFLNNDGVLVYCVCSLEYEEGEGQIEAFLRDNTSISSMPINKDDFPEYQAFISPKGYLITLPHLQEGGGIDGFFISKLYKKF